MTGVSVASSRVNAASIFLTSSLEETAGLKGVGIFRRASACQSMLAKKGCDLISSASRSEEPSLFCGYVYETRFIR